MLFHFISDFNKFNIITDVMDIVQLILKDLHNFGYSKYFKLSDSVLLTKKRPNKLLDLFLFLVSGSFSIFYLFVYFNNDLARLIIKLSLVKSLLNISKIKLI